MRIHNRAIHLAVIVGLLLPVCARADDAPATKPTSQFIRYIDDNNGGGRLETSIVTYTNPAGVKVHLVSAVHVGDKAYYDRLNKTFKTYDVLLYEMVKPKGAGVPQPGEQTGSPISFLQRSLKNVLGLQFQLDAIDYNAANFVHADLDTETFHEMQDERGESILGLMLQQVLSEMARDDDGNDKPPEVQMAEFFAALASPDRPRQLKLLLGQQFEDIENKLAGLDGENGSVLLTERNKAAVRTLERSLKDGNKEIGIFYGGAHMRDLSGRIEQLGFKRTDSQWLTAWDMSPATTQPAASKAITPPAPQAQPN